MLDFLKVNLQLFADETHEDVVDSQGGYEEVEDYDGDIEDDVQEYDDDDYSEEDDEGDELDSELDEEEEVVDPQEDDDKQSPEENARMKKIRLRAEEQARKKVELELAEEKKKIESMRISLEQKQAEKAIMDEYTSPRKVQDYAYENDMTEEKAREMLTYQAKEKINADNQERENKFYRLQEVKKQLSKDKYFSVLEEEVDTLHKQNPSLDYEVIYKHTLGNYMMSNSKKLESKLASKVEKRTIANMHDRSRRKSSQGVSGGARDTSELSSFTKELNGFMGIDSNDVGKIVKKRGRKRK